MNQDKHNKVSLELTKEEAIVLFEFLERFNKIEHNPHFEDQSELRILWDIECTLEQKLSESFRIDYQEIVNRARKNIRDKGAGKK